MSCTKTFSNNSPNLESHYPTLFCAAKKGVPSFHFHSSPSGVNAAKPCGCCDNKIVRKCDDCATSPACKTEHKHHHKVESGIPLCGAPLCSNCLALQYNLTPTQIGDLRPKCSHQ